MKISHLDAMCQVKGFESFKDFITEKWLKSKRPLEEIADDMEISVSFLRKMITKLDIDKPIKTIPVTLQDARRMTVDGIASKYKVPRSTAWRWRQAILNQHADGAGDEVIVSPDAALKLMSDD